MKKTIIVLFFILFSSLAYSQKVKLSAYHKGFVGVDYQVFKKMNIALRFKTNSAFSSMKNEFLIFHNILGKEHYTLRTGIGLNFNLFDSYESVNSFVFPLQLEFVPLKDYSNLSLVYELSVLPYIEGEVFLRSLIGIKFRF